MSTAFSFLKYCLGGLVILAIIGAIFTYFGGFVAVGLSVITPIIIAAIAIFVFLCLIVVVLHLFGYSVDTATRTLQRRPEREKPQASSTSRSQVVESSSNGITVRIVK
ncbi:hypothetical protein FWG86_00090 [Candidatus Saccharibacteria bacterium]|nr:hypothetical protein [Candidatus Saccharibacteria bacterium]